MIKKVIVAALLVAGSACPTAFAQVTASSSTEMPAVKEAPAGQESGLLSGEKPFTLMVDENVGELIYEFDEETKELESINAKRGVIFASEDMTLNSDEMEYKTLNSSLVATGKRVIVRMGDMIITCQIFKYNPETQEGEFEGHPIVYQRNKDGKVTETAGRIISVVNVNGKFQMRVGSGGGISTYVRSTGVASDTTGNLEKKTLAPGQKGASMTLNNNPSSLASDAPARGGSAGSNAGGFMPVPNLDRDSAPSVPKAETEPAAKPSGKIDPNSASDVKKLTGEKAN